MFTVTLRRPIEFEKWVEKLTDHRVKILRQVQNNPKVTKKELEQAVNISASAIDNNIDIHKNLGLLTREGSDKEILIKIKIQKKYTLINVYLFTNM